MHCHIWLIYYQTVLYRDFDKPYMQKCNELSFILQFLEAGRAVV